MRSNNIYILFFLYIYRLNQLTKSQPPNTGKMKKTLLLSFLLLFTGLVSHAQLTITTNVCSSAESVRLTGPWWGWNPVGGPVGEDNGDGTWTITLDATPTDDMEYKLVVDGFAENLVPAGDFSCVPINGADYANRLWEVGSGNVSGITFGTCSSCSSLVTYGCTNSSALNYNSSATQDDGSCKYGSDLPITFEGSSYEFEGWEGAAVEIADNPSKSGINTSNKVFKVVRNADGQTYAGSTIVTKPIDFFEDSIFKMKVYSPKANIPVTVKFESSAGNTGDFVVNTTKSFEWEELTVNFGDEQPSDVLHDLVIIFNNGTKGDGTMFSTYYLDDIRFDSQTVDNSTPVTSKVNVTFQVDMTGIEAHEDGVYVAGGDQFGQDGHLMTDQGNNVWSVTLELESGVTYKYKFRNQPSFGTWDGFEDANSLAAGGCTTGQYDDRFVAVGSSDITLDLVKYGSCSMEGPAVSGCMDANASDYNAAATIQAKDGNGNTMCNYASCDDIPQAGCIYSTDGVFGPYAEGFGATECTGYGGTPCDSGNNSGDVSGCMDSNASNYNADATSQAMDQYGNLLCVFTSCDQIPGDGGCIYPDSFGPYAEGFGAAECAGYGGTACSDLNLLEGNQNLTAIYPNPASNFIIVADLDYTAVDIYNVTGQLILSERNSQGAINISDLVEGIYTLKIIDINGNLSHSKLIKK